MKRAEKKNCWKKVVECISKNVLHEIRLAIPHVERQRKRQEKTTIETNYALENRAARLWVATHREKVKKMAYTTTG